MCDFRWEGGGGGRRNPTDGNFYHMVFDPGGGGILCDTGFALFWQHDVFPTKNPFHAIIINHIYISRNMSACVVTSQLAHNQRLQVSG